MTVIAVVGDCTTTTCVALAAAWTDDDGVMILEADASGGSLAGWLDTPSSPSLATIVANLVSDPHATGDTIASMCRRSAAGIRFIAAPVRSVPAHRAIEEAASTVVPWLSDSDHVVLADIGRTRGADPLHVAARAAAAILVVHRQEPASTGAAAVRLERLVETIEHVATVGVPIALGVIGRQPFDPGEVARFVDESAPESVDGFVRLAEDSLSAAVLAGREGVSAKRLQRLPLMRTAADAATMLRSVVGRAPTGRHGVAP